MAVSRCLEDKVSGESWEILSIGVPRDEKSFLEKAFAAGHPRSMAIHLSEGVKEVLNSNFRREPYVLIKKRLAYLSKWSSRAKELADQERLVHESLPEHLKGILSGKRLLLMGEMFQDAQVIQIKNWFQTFAVASTYQGGFNNRMCSQRKPNDQNTI